MGMYNYLNGEQVKCFSVPIVYIGNDYTTENEEDSVCFSTMGGLLEGYNKGDKVPYRTSIYNYGPDFIVFDYRGFEDAYMLHFIQHGKVSKSYNLDKLPPVLPVLLVIDNNGNPLNIKSRNDFFEVVKDHKELIENQYFNGLTQIRPMFEDYIDSLRENEPREELKVEYERQSTELRERTLDLFRTKWYLDDSKVISNDIGWLIGDLSAKSRANEEVVNLLSKYKLQSPTFLQDVEDYKEWSKDLYSSDEIDSLLMLEGCNLK